jgi:hypothetical protein
MGTRKQAMAKTNGMTLLLHVWEHCADGSWERLNHAMWHALKLAIGSGMELSRTDFDTIWGRLRGHRWVTGANSEWVYALAVTVGNMAVCKAWEAYYGFEPYYANGVRPHDSQGFQHATGERQRERLAVGFEVRMDNRHWTCTAVGKDGVRFVAYGTGDNYRKVEKRLSLTREKVAELWPAPKRAKKAAVEAEGKDGAK